MRLGLSLGVRRNSTRGRGPLYDFPFDGLLPDDAARFSDAGDWTVEENWSIANGTAQTTTQATSQDIFYDVTIPAGDMFVAYKMLDSNDTGGLRLRFNGPLLDSGAQRRDVGCHAFLMNSVGHTRATLVAQSGWAGSFDEIQIYDISDIQDRPADIYLLAGQSNMAGNSAQPVDPQLDTPDPRMTYLASWDTTRFGGDTDALTPAVDPLQHFDGLGQGVGPGMSAGKGMLSLAGDTRRVVLVAGAKGGTALIPPDANWQPGDNCYDNLVAQANAALALCPAGSKIKGMFWSQGETDSGANVGTTYPPAFETMLTALRTALSEPDLPVVILGPSPEWDTNGRLAAAQALLDERSGDAAAIDNVRFIASPSGYATAGEEVHFTPAGNRLRGAAAAQVMRDILTGADVVPEIEPDFNLAGTLSGRTYTITATNISGDPAPGLTITALTWAGGDVLGDQTGTGPWQYTAPSNADDQTISATVTATNSAGSFSRTVSVSVPADLSEPNFTLEGVLSGRTYTITATNISGSPAPDLDVTAITWAGGDVLGDETSSGPLSWQYTAPSDAEAQTISVTVTADNGVGEFSRTVSVPVPADLFIPTVSVAPVWADLTPSPGQTVPIPTGTYAGTTPITINGTLLLDGVDVTANISNGDYSIPLTAGGDSLAWSEVPSNAAGTGATQTTTATVSVIEAPEVVVTAGATIEARYDDQVTGDVTYTVTHPGFAETDINRDGPGVFTVTEAQENAIEAGTPLVLINVAITDNGDGTATLTPPLVLYNAAHTAPVTTYAWQQDSSPSGDTGLTADISGAGDWSVIATVPATDAGGSAATSTSNVVTVGATAEITSFTADTGGIIIEYTGTMSITADAGGINFEVS